MKNFFKLSLFTLGVLTQFAPNFSFKNFKEWKKFCEEKNRKISQEDININKVDNESQKITLKGAEEIHVARSWDDIKHTVEKLTSSGQFDMSEILIISDLDGTITTHSDPTKDGDIRIKVDEDDFFDKGPYNFGQKEKSDTHNTTQKGSIAFIEEFIQLKGNFVISSAWTRFDEIMLRVNTIGLGELFGKDPLKKGLITINNNGHKKTSRSYIRLGNVFSVAKIDDKAKYTLYREKFFSGLALSEQERNKIKVIIFVDDQRHNVEKFITDAQNNNFYPNLEQVECFEFKPLKEKLPKRVSSHDRRYEEEKIPSPREKSPHEPQNKKETQFIIDEETEKMKEINKQIITQIKKVIIKKEKALSPSEREMISKKGLDSIVDTIIMTIMSEKNSLQGKKAAQNILNITKEFLDKDDPSENLLDYFISIFLIISEKIDLFTDIEHEEFSANNYLELIQSLQEKLINIALPDDGNTFFKYTPRQSEMLRIINRIIKTLKTSLGYKKSS